MHNTLMRTTVNLDSEAYDFAMSRAHGQDITLGAAISDFIREAVEARKNSRPSPNLKRLPNGLLVFKRKNGRVITSEMVKAALEEDE
jgi:hypothetical protein